MLVTLVIFSMFAWEVPEREKIPYYNTFNLIYSRVRTPLASCVLGKLEMNSEIGSCSAYEANMKILARVLQKFQIFLLADVWQMFK